MDNQIKTSSINVEKDKDLAKSRANMNDLGVDINNAFLSAPLVTKYFSEIVSGIESLATTAYKYLGKELPEEHRLVIERNAELRKLVKSESELTELTKERTKLVKESENYKSGSKKLSETNQKIVELDQQARDLREKIQQNQKKINATLIESGQPPIYSPPSAQSTSTSFNQTGFASGENNVSDVLKFTAGSGSESSFRKMDNKLQQSVIKAAKEYNSTTGKKIQINSAFRELADQQRLWDESKAAGREGLTATGMPIAKPNPNRLSMHQRGLAVDIQNYNDRAAIAIMNKYGLFQTVRNDPVHFTMPGAKTGGIFRGPDTGYLAMLHGDEMVIPANDDITKQNLQNTVLSDDSDNEVLSNLFTMMSDELDNMIDLVSATNTNYRFNAVS
jgi:LAS superfamily LD-carboxypeptidase LdcB